MSEPERRTSSWSVAGIPPASIPFVAAFGLVFMMVTVPATFAQVYSRGPGPSWSRPVQRWLASRASETQTLLDESDVSSWSWDLPRIALMAVGALIVASVVRSIRLRSAWPISAVVGGLVLGVLGLPIAAWGLRLIVLLPRFVEAVLKIVDGFAVWLRPILVVVGVVFYVAAGIWGLYAFVKVLRAHWSRIIGVLVSAFVIAALWTLARRGVARVFRSLGATIGDAAEWLSERVGPVLAVIVSGIFVAAVAVAVVVAVTVVLWAIGQSVVVPLLQSTSAGRGVESCVTVSVGLGVLLGVLLLGAACSPLVRSGLIDAWGGLGVGSEPIDLFDWLTPEPFDRWLAPGFVSYSPLADSGLIILVSLFAIPGLLFSRSRWGSPRWGEVAWPAIVTLVLALLIAIPMLVLTKFAGSESS